MLSWGLLVWVLIGAGTAWFWHDSLGVREQANKAAMQACEELRLQFLDGTVAFARLWPARGYTGRMTLRRTYVFDYTTDSVARRQGFIVLLGTKVESVGFAHDSTPARTATLVEPPRELTPASPPAVTGNVYDLDSWRENLRRSRERRDDAGNGEA
ncbi:MAG: DUF3301 domain-containing protein [Steroidobacteraceae bacterium]